MHPPNHGIKHKLIMESTGERPDNQSVIGYPTFDSVAIAEFGAYGPKPTHYHPLSLIYDNGQRVLCNAIVYKSDKFKLIY